MYAIFAKLCEEHKVTPYKVGKDLDISSSTLSEWKAGKYTPKVDKIMSIAEYFGISVENFYKREG